MAPVRGVKRKRRQEKKAEENAADGVRAALGQEPSDWWEDFSRRIAGPLSTSGGVGDFKSIFKMPLKTFNYVCSLVKEDLISRASNFTYLNGKALSVNDQVAVALRRLCSGESLLIVGQSFGVNQSTVSQVTWRFVEAMEERGLHHLRWPTTKEMDSIKIEFEKIRGLPNCCGIIGTTHIMMCLPSVDPSNTVWVDYEKHHSMTLQAILDPQMRFRDVVTGWPGSVNEFLILQNSGFFKLCEKGTRLSGNKLELSERTELREYIIGDAGYPLLPWLLTPFQGKDLADPRVEFNKRHQATRLVAQRAFARLKDVWRILQGEMWRPDKHRLPRIILVCCILHNIVIDLEDEARDQLLLSPHHDSGYRQQYCNFSEKSAHALREKLSQYLFGSLPP